MSPSQTRALAAFTTTLLITVVGPVALASLQFPIAAFASCGGVFLYRNWLPLLYFLCLLLLSLAIRIPSGMLAGAVAAWLAAAPFRSASRRSWMWAGGLGCALNGLALVLPTVVVDAQSPLLLLSSTAFGFFEGALAGACAHAACRRWPDV
jgi:hypothetical protein